MLFPVVLHLYVLSDRVGALSRILVYLAVGCGSLSSDETGVGCLSMVIWGLPRSPSSLFRRC